MNIKNCTCLSKLESKISNSIIIGVSLIIFGLFGNTYLNAINNYQLMHMKYRDLYIKKQIDKQIDLSNLIDYENKLISYNWKCFNISFILGITGVIVVVKFYQVK